MSWVIGCIMLNVNNALILLLTMATIPAGYIVVNQVIPSEEPTIRELTKEELAELPTKLSEYQEQADSNSPKKLPRGVQELKD